MTVAALSTGPARRAWTVTQLVRQIQVGLAESFPGRFWVEGELSGFKVARNRHAFCCLKDEDAQVEAIVWADRLEALPFTPADGMRVFALVRKVDFWAPTGRLRLQIDAFEPAGVGALARALEQLKARLQAEGLFDEARKRPLPFLPRTVGIATAASGAAIHDMLEVLTARFSRRRILLRPCRVQGEGAPADIAAAIDDLNRDGSSEVIIVGRGGGSVEDLWAFNSEAVVRAIARSRIPVVSAVGHESDFTLADLVADLRVPTPTAAAQRVMPEHAALEKQLATSAARLEGALDRRVELARSRLEGRERAFSDPRRLLVDRQRQIEALAARARIALGKLTPARRSRLDRAAAVLSGAVPDGSALRGQLERAGMRLVAAMGHRRAVVKQDVAARAAGLEALSPLAVLARGFALARRADGSIVRDAAVLSTGERMELRFARGGARVELLETVADIAPLVATEPALEARKARAGRTQRRGS